jgi:hypothetical protein
MKKTYTVQVPCVFLEHNVKPIKYFTVQKKTAMNVFLRDNFWIFLWVCTLHLIKKCRIALPY